MHVRVDADVLQALERQDEHEIRGLPPDARKCEELLHGAWHPAAVAFDEDAARCPDVPRLVPIEADRINQPLNLLDRQPRHRSRRARDAKQPRRGRSRDGIARLRRQHGRDEHVERIFPALFSDFFDRRQLEMVDRPRERTHDGEHGSRRGFRHYFG